MLIIHHFRDFVDTILYLKIFKYSYTVYPQIHIGFKDFGENSKSFEAELFGVTELSTFGLCPLRHMRH